MDEEEKEQFENTKDNLITFTDSGKQDNVPETPLHWEDRDMTML